MPYRRLLAPLALVLLGACAHAPPPDAEHAEAPTWRRLPVGESGLTAEWPSAPRVSHFSARDARPTNVWIATAHRPDVVLRVAVAEEPGGLAGQPIPAVDTLTRSLMSDQGMFMMGARPRTRFAYPGFHALGGRVPGPNGVAVMTAFIGRERVYVAVAIAARSEDAYDAANRFVDSIVPDPSDAMTRGPAAEDRWTEVTWAVEAFSIRMPPVERDAVSEAQVGAHRAIRHVLEATEGGATYRLRVYGFRRAPPLGEEVAESLGVTGDTAPIHASGFPGLERRGDDGSVQRIYRTDDHIYVAEVEPAPGGSAPRADAFLSSLHLL